MARPPLLSLTGVTLRLGARPLFEGVDLTLARGVRAALVGRNGSGKSTLMRVMAGLTEPDEGERHVPAGVRIAYMPQAPDFSDFATLGEAVESVLAEEERFRAPIVMSGLGIDPQIAVAGASGGELRRAALAQLVAQEPDLMLLDEPTNHLDIAAISWLEAHLDATRAGFVLISHDRAFLARLTRTTLWLDRGRLRVQERGFAEFEDWRDRMFAEEDAERHKLDRLIRAEGRWAVEGISARRRRNQGRLRRLAALRAERKAQIARSGPAKMALEAGAKSGRLVVEAEHVAKRFGKRVILRDFSIRILRGDRIAVVGPNGAGKTTLIRLLSGEIAPDSGTLRLGTGLVPAVFDQSRAGLDPARSLWETLTLDPALARSGASDQIMVRGRPRHVIGYLRDFLFTEDQARGPVSALSGGERARLMLARIMARESNLLILDEPTNDLDIETLDLLQELLDDYAGTVLMVSHDRDFIDRIATATVLMPGDGSATVYAGGWSDLIAQGGRLAPPEPVEAAGAPARRRAADAGTDARTKA
ncbi:MAG: ABC transporter ATP-binding protein, partial [Alphaproteobacteria bacterium]